MKTRIGLVSALIYISVSLITSGLFLTVTLIRDYTWVARIGGSVWVFILSMIILIPSVTTMVKRKYNG
ncbi:MAG: hypothetical protein C4542_01710 [Dehalococcoidia bacterium]|nr:MAG: hypothetical protein C4542_01710 [Dehalococcoidia bacterium]